MPRVEAFAVPGFELWFNSDDHRPPHFHAEKSGAWEVRVFFMRGPSEMFDVIWTVVKRRPRKSELESLGQLAEEHRLVLLEEWQAKVNVRDPGPEG